VVLFDASERISHELPIQELVAPVAKPSLRKVQPIQYKGWQKPTAFDLQELAEIEHSSDAIYLNDFYYESLKKALVAMMNKLPYKLFKYRGFAKAIHS